MESKHSPAPQRRPYGLWMCSLLALLGLVACQTPPVPPPQPTLQEKLQQDARLGYDQTYPPLPEDSTDIR